MATTAPVSHAPDLKKFLKSLKGQSPQASVSQLVALLKRRQVAGPEPCAIATAYTLRQVVAQSKWTDVATLLSAVDAAGRLLSAAQPHERAIANVTRRILATIRNEAEEDRADDVVGESAAPTAPATGTTTPQRQILTSDGGSPRPTPSPSRDSTAAAPKTLLDMLTASPAQPPSSATTLEALAQKPRTLPTAVATAQRLPDEEVHRLKVEVMECIQELVDEIESVDEMISGVSDIPLYPDDAVLLFNPSPAVERLVLRIASKKKFSVFLVAPPTPARAPPKLAPATDPDATADASSRTAAFKRKLAAAGASVVTLRTSNIMAYMPRMTKVFLDAHAVAADGGFVADAGAGVVARAAAVHGRPVFVLAGVYKLSAQTPAGRDEWVAPGGNGGAAAARVGFGDGALVRRVRVRGPDTEWVDGRLVDIYVTSLGMHSREQLREVIADTYHEASGRDGAGGD